MTSLKLGQAVANKREIGIAAYTKWPNPIVTVLLLTSTHLIQCKNIREVRRINAIVGCRIIKCAIFV